MKRILNLILLVFTLAHGYGQENVHRYIGADGSVIKIKNGVFVYLTPVTRGEGGGYDTLAVCSLRRVNEHFVELNKKETLAQIFTDIRYTKKDNEAMSEGFLLALKRQGFLKQADN